jgi:UrcA family protein
MMNSSNRFSTSVGIAVLAGGVLQLASIGAQADGAKMITTTAHSPAVVAIAGDGLAREAVSYADLDLSSSEGMRTLNARIKSAVNNVCGNATRTDLRSLQAEANCRDAASKGAAAKVHALQARALAARAEGVVG